MSVEELSKVVGQTAHAGSSSPSATTNPSGSSTTVFSSDADPLDLDPDDVADLEKALRERLAHGADPGGRAGGDDVARLERERCRQVRDLLEAVVDHLLGVAVLAELAR